MPAKRTLSFLATAILLATAAASLCDDTPGGKYYANRLGKVAKVAAARLWEAADRARRDSLFRYAREEARRVLDLDPDNHAARAFLGYVKKGDAWEMDLAQSGKLPTENQQGPIASVKLADAEQTWRTVIAPRADLDVAAMYASLGDECLSKGYKAEAEAAYRTALTMDRDNAAAHRGLGDAKFGDGLWMTAEASRALAAAILVHPIDDPDRLDDVFGEKLAKAESGHFRVESPHTPELIALYLTSCEKAFAAYLADIGLDPDTPVFPKRPVFCVLQTGQQWDRWINKMTRGNPGFYRGLTCHWARDLWQCALNPEGATQATRCDRVAHESVHMMNLALWSMPDGCWLDDALAYRYTVLIQGTTYSYCLAPRKEDYAKTGQQRNWTEQSQWKPLIREIVTAKDDLALRAIVSKSSYDLPLYASIKAWSVVDFLMKRDRAAFVGMLKDLKGEKNLVGLLETHFGKDVETLDEQWRAWVIATY